MDQSDRTLAGAWAALPPDARATLARRLRRAAAATAAPEPVTPARAAGGEAPLSLTQERFWLRQQALPGDFAANVFLAVRLRGELRPAALRVACDGLLRRHGVLRSRFVEVDGGLRQQVRDAWANPVLRERDLGRPAGGDGRAALEPIARDEAERPFDLAADLPMRALLVAVAPDEHVLMLTLHHVATDARSNAVLLADLAEGYRLACAGQPDDRPPVGQFGDYARWQRHRLDQAAVSRLAEHWRQALAGAPHGLDLPYDRTPSAAGVDPGRLTSVVPGPSVERLAEFSRAARVPLFAALQAVLQVLLHRYGGATDFLVGSPVSGRQRPELARLVGPLFSTVPLRADLSGQPTFRELVGRVRAAVAAAFSHSELAPDRLPGAPAGGRPPYDVLFALQEADRPVGSVAGLRIEALDLGRGVAQCPLTVSAVPGPGGLLLTTDYDRRCFDGATVRQLTGHYARLVETLVTGADLPVGRVPLLSGAERRTLLVDWNRAAQSHRAAEAGPSEGVAEAGRPDGIAAPERSVGTLVTGAGTMAQDTVSELFVAQARRTPDAPALRHGGARLSYGQLLDAALAHAGLLTRAGVGRGDVVAVSVERSTDLVVCLLGVLLAGAAYLPLDPAHPAERRRRSVVDARARLLLTGRDPQSRLSDTGCPVLGPEERAARVRDGGGSWRPVGPDDLAYVMYTSGSTGAPKGVQIAHGGICVDLRWRRAVTGIGPGERLLHTVSFAFDPSVWQLFGPLCTGAEVVLAGAGEAGDPARFVELVTEHRITVADFVPSLLARVLDAAPPGALGTLRHAFCGGERLPRTLAERFRRQVPGATLRNQYGPTEATIDTSSQPVGAEPSGQEVGIGRPITGKRVYVLDRHLEPVPVRVGGELWIGGAGLAYGYLGAPARTAEVFRPDPYGPPGSRVYRSGDLVRHRHDGTLEFVGRIDDQVKVNGVRVEPAEVADVLRDHSAVADAVVAVRDVEGRPALVGYLVPATADGVDRGALRRHLARRLPAAFVPAHLVPIDAVPLGPNGKVAVDRLPAVVPAGDGVPGRPPRPGTPEEPLAALWCELLDRDTVGADEDFFALGGDSLVAVRLVGAVRERFAVELTLHEFFEAPTVAALAARVAAGRAAAGSPGGGPVRRDGGDGTAPLSYPQERVHRRVLAGAGPAETELELVARLDGELDVAALGRAVDAVVARHEALRVGVGALDGVARQVVRPAYRVPLETVDGPADRSAGLLDLERGVLLRSFLGRLGPRSHELRLVVHRIAFDGVSARILARDLAVSYAALAGAGDRSAGAASVPTLPLLSVQYPDHARWERETLTPQVVAEALRGWRRSMPGLDMLAGLRSVGGVRRQRAVVLDAVGRDALLGSAQRHRCSLRTVLLTAWAAACHRRIGADLPVCVPVAGRDQPQVRDLVGRFVNMAVVPVRFGGARDFADRLGLVRAAAVEAYRAQRSLPFVALERAVAGEASGPAPAFPLLFDLTERLVDHPPVPGLAISVSPSAEPWTDFGLALQAHQHTDRLELLVLHDPELHADHTVSALLDDVRAVLDAAAGPLRWEEAR